MYIVIATLCNFIYIKLDVYRCIFDISNWFDYYRMDNFRLFGWSNININSLFTNQTLQLRKIIIIN